MSSQLHAPMQRPQEPAETALPARAQGGVALADVTHSYRDRANGIVEALARVSFRLQPERTLALVGPSGCGKTTLLELICGLQRPERGLLESAPAVLMPQRDLLMPWLNALDNAALALRAIGMGKSRARERAQPLFDELGLSGFEHAMPHELSGGMRQRVAFLRTLLSGKPVLCLDEPFGALDAITRQQMQEWLQRVLTQSPRTVVLVTHDVEEAVLLADRIIVLSSRPGTVQSELEIDLPRPRLRTQGSVHSLRAQVLDALGLSGQTGVS